MAQWVIAATDAVNMDNAERTTGIRDSTEIAAHQADWWLFLTDKDPVPDRHTIGQEKRCSILQSDRSRVPRPKITFLIAEWSRTTAGRKPGLPS
jgi:hypothetical protein